MYKTIKRDTFFTSLILVLQKSQSAYLYGTCLAPFVKARMTLPKAVRDRHRPPPPSLLLLSTFSQLPRSMRCSLLLPPDTGREKRKQEGKQNTERKQETKKSFKILGALVKTVIFIVYKETNAAFVIPHLQLVKTSENFPST